MLPFYAKNNQSRLLLSLNKNKQSKDWQCVRCFNQEILNHSQKNTKLKDNKQS